MMGFRDLMALVGEFLFRWSAMELALSEAILAAEGSPGHLEQVKGPLVGRLERWRALHIAEHGEENLDAIIAQVEQLRQFRNMMVHGLMGGNAAPADGSPPHVRCVEGGWQEPTGRIVTITAEELHHHIEAADACWRAMTHPHAFNYRL